MVTLETTSANTDGCALDRETGTVQRSNEGALPRVRSVHDSVTVYTPDNQKGFGQSIWAEMVWEIYQTRELTWRLFLRDFTARYRQSFLGYVWAIMPSILMVLTFSWLNRTRIFPVGETTLPYPLFVLLGMTVWQLFAAGLTVTTQSLVSASSIVAKINFPRETLVLAAFAQSIFDFAIRLGMLTIAFAVYHVTPAWTCLLIPLIMIPLCLLTIGIGYLSALINVVFRDASQIVALVLTVWMFLTPIFYPAPTDQPHALLNLINPVSPFVIAAQDLTVKGFLTQPGYFAVGCIESIIIFLLGWRIFHISEPRIAERI